METRKSQLDEFTKVRFFMKGMQVWPQDKNAWWRDLHFMSYTALLWSATLLETLFIITNAKKEDPLTLLQVCTDACGTGGTALLALYIRQRANAVLKISNMIASEFAPLEENHTSVKIRASKLAFSSVTVHLLMTASSAMASIAAAWEPPEIRQCSFKAPTFWNRIDILFYPFLVWWLWGHIGYYATNSSIDALIICLTNLIRGKSATLQNILRDLDKIEDEQQRDAELNKIVRHHALLITLHELGESVTSRPMLTKLAFLMIGVGTPTLRILLGEVDASYAAFLFFYIFWVISQLLLYFLLCDAATASAQRIGFEAYSAYRPGMTKGHVGKLCIIMGRAQRPLYFTASKIIKINRRTMLKLVKQSYSIYSAVLRLRRS